MPWEIRQNENQYCVYKEGEDAPLHCYDSEESAKEYIAALYASEPEASKRGSRHSKEDRDAIRKLRKLADEIGSLSKFLEPDDDDEKPEQRMTHAKAQGLPEGPDTGGFYTVIKTAGDWELDVLGVPFGGPNAGKDSDGEYFAPETKTYNDQFPSPPVVYYHGFSPEGKPMGEPAIIGTVQKIWNDAKGWWYRVILNRVNEYAKRIWASAQAGKARASSGSIAHLVRKDRDGKITHWPVVELSLIDAEGKRQPANQYAVAMPVMKAHYESYGIDLPQIDSPEGVVEVAAGNAASVADDNTTIFIDAKGTQWQIKK